MKANPQLFPCFICAPVRLRLVVRLLRMSGSNLGTRNGEAKRHISEKRSSGRAALLGTLFLGACSGWLGTACSSDDAATDDANSSIAGAAGDNGAGASGSTGGSNSSGTGSSSSTGGGGGTPAPECGVQESVASLGAPWDSINDDGPDDHGTMYGARPRVVVAAGTGEGFDVAWQAEGAPDKIYVSHVEPTAGGYEISYHRVVHSLGQIGGLALAANGDIVVVTAIDEDISGEVEPLEQHRDGILQIVRVNADCEETYRVDLRADFEGDQDQLPVYQPFNAGTSRLAVSGDAYVLHYAQMTEYDEGVTSRHQVGRYFVGNLSDGQITREHGDISHSFDQRIVYDGGEFLSLSMGDASLRGVEFSTISAGGDKSSHTIFAAKGGDSATGGGYNNSYTRLGDVAKSENGYVAVFASEAGNDTTERVNVSRNLGLVHMPVNVASIDQDEKYDVVATDTSSGNAAAEDWDVDIKDYWGTTFVGHNRDVVWVTDYADKATAHVERPKLVKLGPNSFMLLWEKWTLDDFDSSWAALVDEYGNITQAATSLGAVRIPRGDDAFALDEGAAWVEAQGGQLTLHVVSPELVTEAYPLQ